MELKIYWRVPRAYQVVARFLGYVQAEDQGKITIPIDQNLDKARILSALLRGEIQCDNISQDMSFFQHRTLRVSEYFTLYADPDTVIDEILRDFIVDGRALQVVHGDMAMAQEFAVQLAGGDSNE